MPAWTKSINGCLLLILLGVAPTIAGEPVVVQFTKLTESSGLAFSTRSNDTLYSHNDSGDTSRLFAFNRAGKSLCELHIQDAGSQDWEDLCSFEYGDDHWLAIADTGDNDRRRSSVRLYLLKEPQLNAKDASQKTKVDLEIRLTYPEGPVDCEAVAYDPRSHALVLLSKELLTSRVFRVDLPTKMKGRVDVVARQIGRLAIPMVTAADISRDGQQLVVGTYGPACLLERRDLDLDKAWRYSDQAVGESFLAVPFRKQGEAICFSPTGSHLWLTSEFRPTPLYEVAVPPVTTAQPK